RHHGTGADAAGQRMSVLAVGAGDVVVGAERGQAADRHRLLADVEVTETADLAEAVGLAGLLLDPADQHHLAEPAPVFLGPRGVEPAPARPYPWGRGAGHQRTSRRVESVAATTCSQAWYDDRVSGLACTCEKPIASPRSRSSANSSGA